MSEVIELKIEELLIELQKNNISDIKKEDIYPLSINKVRDSIIFMVKDADNKKHLITIGELNKEFVGEDFVNYKKSPLNHENANKIRELLPFTKPKKVLREKRSFGLGDRLGIATIGHIRLFKKYDCYPVFAQQSIRELNLTERTYEDVLDCVSFSVLQEGFKKGFGADGDHLKKASEVEYALGLGYTMITLDCSEHIRNDILDMSDSEVVKEAYVSKELKAKYLNKKIDIEGNILEFTLEELSRCKLIYGDAITFATAIYNKYFKTDIADFEISIDETETPTSPLQHYFVAKELTDNLVHIVTLAPRFCGEFQKGVDYIGDINQFEKELSVHAAISRHFGYKLSIHSGSDKFKTFALIGQYTKGNFHVKTAGTNWLEAMKVVAKCDPVLYREIHKFAISKFVDAKKFYHVTTNLDNIPSVDSLKDNELVDLFKLNDARQLIHITYGFILTSKDENGEYLFKNRLYKLWMDNTDVYANMLETHIGKHLELLYSGFKGEK